MIKLKLLLNQKIFEEQINRMLSKVTMLIESRISDFRKKYNKISQNIMDIFIEQDPSESYKYLDWLGKVATIKQNEVEFTENDANELMKYINIFHKKISGIDIYSFKDLDDFIEYVSKKNKEVGKKKSINKETKLLFLNDYIRIVAPESHESSKYFGGSTQWCISTSSEGHWKQYYCEQGDSIVFVIFRKTGEKYAIVGYDLKYANFFDENDKKLDQLKKEKLIGKLQKETNNDEENAWDIIEDHFDYDDRDERMYQYQEEKLIEDFDENKKDLDKTIKRIMLEKVFGNKDSVLKTLTDDKWEKYIEIAFENKYNDFLFRIYSESAWNHGFESAGYIRNFEQIYQFSDREYDEEIDHLILLIKQDNFGDLDKIIKNVLDNNAYELLLDNFFDEYTQALESVKIYLNNILNDPKQDLFSFGGKLKPIAKSFENLIKLMYKLGYENLARQIVKYAMGEYNKNL